MPRNLVFLIVVVVGGVFLQIFLAKKENKWLGLILPIISFVFSLLGALSVPVFNSFTSDSGQSLVQNNIAEAIVPMIIILVISNIPTAILLTIYFACREKIKKNKELEKMKIEDL